MEKRYYKLDKEAFIKELKKYEGMRAIGFNLPENDMYGGGEEGEGIIEILYDNPDGKKLLYYSMEISNKIYRKYLRNGRRFRFRFMDKTI